AGKRWLANMDHRASKCGAILEPDHDDDSCDICSLEADDITGEQLANARLISQAPAMAEALDNLVEIVCGLTHLPDDPDAREWVNKSEAILARVKGEQTEEG